LRRNAVTLALVWLTAFNLRTILFAIPPTLPDIRSELGLSFSATGSITSLAVFTMGIASIPGALLATRFGARRLVSLCGAGLVTFTVALTLPPGIFWVFAGSSLLTLSIAIAQPPLAVLIRRWFPTTITRASSLYSNGLLMGNVLGASLSPYISHAFGWRTMFLVWAAIAGLGVLLWLRFTPRDRMAAPPVHLGAVMRDPRTWQIAALFTFQNLVYYTVATWIPFLLPGRGADYLATTFLFLNFFPIVPLLALSFVRWPYALSTPYYVVAGTLAILGCVGLFLGLTQIVWPLAFMVGLGTGAAFVGAIALPPLIAGDESQASTYSALMYTAGYLLAFVGPLSAGLMVDATGNIAVAFLPPIAGAALMALAGSLAPRSLSRSRLATVAR
jgi:CP family cyanate transporter-like MFS transporter